MKNCILFLSFCFVCLAQSPHLAAQDTDSTKVDLSIVLGNPTTSLHSIIQEVYDDKVVTEKKVVHHFLTEKAFNKVKEAYEAHSSLDKLKEFRITVYNLEGKKIDVFDNGEDISLMNSFASDIKIKILTAKYPLQAGRLEVYSKIESSNTLFIEKMDLNSFSFNTDKIYVELNNKSSKALHFIERNLKGNDQDTVGIIAAGETYKKTLGPIVVKKAESKDYKDPFLEKNRGIFFRADEFVLGKDNLKGSLRSWKTFSRDMYGFYEAEENMPEEAKQELLELTKDIEDPVDKARAVYKYVQKNMRYVSIQLGEGGWIPFDNKYVYEKGIGDCKALTLFTKAAFNTVGIEAYPALIKTATSQRKLLPNFPNPYFNHVILKTIINDSTYWVECTSKVTDFGQIGSEDNHKEVLVLHPTDGKIETTNAIVPKFDFEKYSLNFKLEKGKRQVESHYRINYGGRTKQIFSPEWDQSSTEDLKKYLAKSHLPTSTTYIDNIVKQGFDDVSADSATVDVDFIANKPIRMLGTRAFVDLDLGNPFLPTFNDTTERKQDIYIEWNTDYEDVLILDFDQAYDTESAPDPILIDNEKIYLKRAFVPNEDHTQLQIIRKFHFKKNRYPAEDYTYFKELIEQAEEFDKRRLVLKKM